MFVFETSSHVSSPRDDQCSLISNSGSCSDSDPDANDALQHQDWIKELKQREECQKRRTLVKLGASLADGKKILDLKSTNPSLSKSVRKRLLR